MAVICFGGVAGAPGTTTTALTVAATWPDDRVLFVEANPDGGVLLVRYRLARQVGLISLAAALRHGVRDVHVRNHAQNLRGGLWAVPAPDSPIQAHNALMVGANLGHWLRRLDRDVIVDVGRLRPDSPTIPLLTEADLVLVCSRSIAEQIQPGAALLEWLRERQDRAGWCLIGDKPHSIAEVERVHGWPVLGNPLWDPSGAKAVTKAAGVSLGRRRRSSSPYVKSVRKMSQSLYTSFHSSDETSADPDDAEVSL